MASNKGYARTLVFNVCTTYLCFLLLIVETSKDNSFTPNTNIKKDITHYWVYCIVDVCLFVCLW